MVLCSGEGNIAVETQLESELPKAFSEDSAEVYHIVHSYFSEFMGIRYNHYYNVIFDIFKHSDSRLVNIEHNSLIL